MAVVLKKTQKASLSAASLLTTFQKDMGDGVGSFGGMTVNTDRIPTGLFELDLALAGGFPVGKVSMIYGPESSNKTNIALLAVANHQRLWPKLVCVFVDLENEFAPDWAAKLGVDTTKLIVLRPAYAEQAVDMIEGLLLADDVGLIVLDAVLPILPLPIPDGVLQLLAAVTGVVAGGDSTEALAPTCRNPVMSVIR